jgi:ABC-type Fe3+/spermidine/putrescine transport system ATPase subunit
MDAPVLSDGGLILDRVSKRFGTLEAVRSVSVEIKSGEFFSLLGPSGCGKTTLLRIIGGFEQPDAGGVSINGLNVTKLPPQKRPTAMVFQNYALFPNMTVGENVAYGLRVRRMAAGNRRKRVSEALQRVDMAGSEDRPVTLLSGGQQQRVAVARALAVEPDVLLFDEPLSNLDAALREQTRAQLKSLHRQLGTTSVYVTHDQSEALVLSDRIGVMRSGELVEVGPPEKLFEEPASAFVASFLGGWNIVRDSEVAQQLTGQRLPPQSALAVRPDKLQIVDPPGEGFEVQVVARNYLGLHAECWLDGGGQTIRMLVNPSREPSGSIRIKAGAFRIVSTPK